MIYVLEGPDGSGKTTIAKFLARALEAKLYEFPRDDGYTGPAIRSYLRREWQVIKKSTDAHDDASTVDERLGALTHQALQIANRMEVMPELMKARGHATRHVVCARYWPSAVVYGQLDGLDASWLINAHQAMAHADHYMLLDLPPEESMRRRFHRDYDGAVASGKPVPLPERYEAKLETYKRVRELFADLWSDEILHADFGGFWRTIDASQPIEVVLADVQRRIGLIS